MNAFYVVLFAPFVSFALLALLPGLRRSGKPAAWTSIAAVTLSLLAAVWLFFQYDGGVYPVSWVWIPLEHFPPLTVGFLVDGLSVVMALVVALVAFAVQVYSLGYMSEESPSSLGRYYTYHSLFTFSMLGLVFANNLLEAYIFWELVGACSYLLIGFWFYKPSAARAALKAFWTTRLGDVGFALGIAVLFAHFGFLSYEKLFALEPSHALFLGLLGVYVGAMGKSAQFPLHIWLPDAMEGPTPVSALIHAATMVAAGVFLMVRLMPALQHTPELLHLVLWVGALTAFLAATMALVERDIKRVLAFSTISQLGYMMAAVGALSAGAAFFHLFTHAFFKALLFLAAGSVIHAMHTNDMFAMGGLGRPMRWTMILFLVGALALAGIPPLSGYFSKDEILLATAHAPGPFALLAVTVFLTAFYMFRAFFLTFTGEPRDPEAHPHESPVVMLWPMGVLAILAVVAGFFGPTVHSMLDHTLGAEALQHAAESHHPAWIPYLGLGLGLLGILVAWMGYVRRIFQPERIYATFYPLAKVLEERYFIDHIFLLFYWLGYNMVATVVGFVDRYIVDGVVNLVTWGTFETGKALRRFHNGVVQDILLGVVVGFLILAFFATGF